VLLKLGVSIEKLNRNIRRALPIIEAVFVGVTGNETVITSTYEGNHSLRSLHYANDAVDIRLPKKREEVSEIIDKLKVALGKNYDVVISTFCIHIEWDPK